MKSKIIATIPVFNGEAFIGQALQSLAEQTLRPDRVVVLDNCSTDGTERVVKAFKGLPVEWRRNEANLGCFGNCNRCLQFASETEYLHILCADDMVTPDFYATLTGALADCKGYGLAYALDERIDEENRRLSVSGRVTGEIEVQNTADFLRQKAEIANQALSGSLLKTGGQPAPCSFRLDLPILADVMFWAEYGRHCEKIVRVHRPLVRYRWHGANETSAAAPHIQSLVLDEWRVMQMIEQLRGANANPVRRFKLKGLFAVRSGIKAKRFREQGNRAYSRQIVAAAREISGPLAWFLAQVLVHARDVVVYNLGGRKKHPKNVYG
jgi:glycosyltransferase involved in cell wall biosynthesis